MGGEDNDATKVCHCSGLGEVSVTPLCPSSPGVPLPSSPQTKPHRWKSQTREKSHMALARGQGWERGTSKIAGSQRTAPAWGRGLGSSAQALSKFSPKPSCSGRGDPSGRQREDKAALTPPLPKKTDEGACQDPSFPTGITQLHARGQLS